MHVVTDLNWNHILKTNKEQTFSKNSHNNPHFLSFLSLPSDSLTFSVLSFHSHPSIHSNNNLLWVNHIHSKPIPGSFITTIPWTVTCYYQQPINSYFHTCPHSFRNHKLILCDIYVTHFSLGMYSFIPLHKNWTHTFISVSFSLFVFTSQTHKYIPLSPS